MAHSESCGPWVLSACFARVSSEFLKVGSKRVHLVHVERGFELLLRHTYAVGIVGATENLECYAMRRHLILKNLKLI